MAVSTPEPAPSWVVPFGVRHERVVWLAARAGLVQLHSRWWHWFARALSAPAPMGADGYAVAATDRESLRASLEQASVIVDGLAGHFSLEERETVRRTGVLPDWFWPVYRGAFADARREVGALSLRR